jgi:hypothetical protein
MSTNNVRRNVALAQAEQVSPLLLVSKLDLSGVDDEKLVMMFENDVTQKLSVPCNDMSSPEMFLHTYNEFLEASIVLQLEDEEKFTYYRRTLRGAARMNWDTSIVGIERTDDGFEEAIQAFALTIMTDEAHDNLLHYLGIAVKPRSMDAKAVMNRLLLLNLFSTRLPNTTGLPAAEIGTVQLKTIFFRMMPMTWQNKFKESGNRLVDYTPLELAEYMNTLSSIENTSRAVSSNTVLFHRNDRTFHNRAGRGHGRGNNRTNHYGRGSNRRARDDNRDSNPRDQSRRRESSQSGGRIDRPQNSDVCRVHGGHTWGQCYLNPSGTSYRPRGGGSNNNNDRNQRTSGRSSQNYHVDNQNRSGADRPVQQAQRDQRNQGSGRGRN